MGTRGTTDSLTPRRFMTRETQHAEDREHDLQRLHGQRQEAEDGIRPAGNGEGDGEHVVDEKRAARDHAEGRGEELACHEVPAAARREELHDLRVAGGDDEDRDRGGERHEDAQVPVAAQGEEGFLGAVVGGGQPVRAEPDPREEGDERELVEDASGSRMSRAPPRTMFFRRARKLVLSLRRSLMVSGGNSIDFAGRVQDRRRLHGGALAMAPALLPVAAGLAAAGSLSAIPGLARPRLPWLGLVPHRVVELLARAP